MFDEVDTKVPRDAEECVASIYRSMFPDGDRGFVRQAFGWAGQFFSGEYDDYHAIDALYHDFEHTLQGTLCLARLLHGRHEAKAQPALSERGFQLGLLAILFHDTGYLKKKDDTEGTGAKYTLTHVSRSAAFAREFLSRKGWTVADTTAIQHMIRCTGVNVDLEAIPFQNDEERMMGYVLGTVGPARADGRLRLRGQAAGALRGICRGGAVRRAGGGKKAPVHEPGRHAAEDAGVLGRDTYGQKSSGI